MFKYNIEFENTKHRKKIITFKKYYNYGCKKLVKSTAPIRVMWSKNKPQKRANFDCAICQTYVKWIF